MSFIVELLEEVVDMGGPVQVHLRVTDTGVDDEQIDALTRHLRAELLDLEIPVRVPAVGHAPDGAKAIEPAALGTLAITLLGSPMLAKVVETITVWLGRQRQGTVKLEVDGDVLELSGVPFEEQRRLADEWLQRHQEAHP